MMLPLEVRKNRLLTIHIRAIALELTKYKLHVINEEGNEFVSNDTDNTMLPKFEFDGKNNELTKYITTTDQTTFKFVLVKSLQDEKIVEFSVDISELLFICDEMSKARIKNYPIIIFEFTEGFYTTKDLYINNTLNYKFEEFNFNSNFGLNSNSISNQPFNKKMSMITNTGSTVQNSVSTMMTLNSSLYSSTNRKEIKFSSLNEKFKQFDFWDRQRNVIKIDKLEKMKSLDDELNIAHEKCENYLKKYQKLINIDKMRKQILSTSEKIEVYEMSIENLKKLISRKQSQLNIYSSLFYLNRGNYMEELKNVDLNYKRIEKYKIMYNAFKNKKLIEVTFFFFNKLCTKLFTIPHFYRQKFDNSNKIIKHQYFEKHNKEISVTLGTIASLINYLSKLFNIPLKHPLFINGSRSYIVVNKKEFIPFYIHLKEEDKFNRLELAISYQEENLREILKFFNINPDEENDGTYKKSQVSGRESNLFTAFYKLSLFLVGLVEKNKLIEDIN